MDSEWMLPQVRHPKGSPQGTRARDRQPHYQVQEATTRGGPGFPSMTCVAMTASKF